MSPNQINEVYYFEILLPHLSLENPSRRKVVTGQATRSSLNFNMFFYSCVNVIVSRWKQILDICNR